MKSLFTIHGGEYLFGNVIERRYPEIRIWIPSKDVGIDFLLTDSKNKNPLSIQVKYSRDFNWSYGNGSLKTITKSIAWYSLYRKKIEESIADYWVLVNYDGFRRSTDFIFITPQKLLEMFHSLGRTGDRIESYVLVTDTSKCYEARGLSKKEIVGLPLGKLDKTSRDMSNFLERWDIIEKHFRIKK